MLARNPQDFTPVRPDRAPWQQPSGVVGRGDRQPPVVPLGLADRVHPKGLDPPSWEQDWLEPRDWMPVGRGKRL